MTQYVVQPGESPASVAGKLYGDQRRYVDLIAANGGNWHPGQVIDIPDISGTPSPVITAAQFAAAQTGYKGGQPQYRGAAGGAAAPTPTSYSKPKTPNFGSAGYYDQRTGAGAGTSPWSVHQTAPTPAQAAPTTTKRRDPFPAGTYDKRTGQNAGVYGAGPGAMPSTQGARWSANPNQWPPLPGATGTYNGVGSGGLRVPQSVQAPNPYAGNGPNPLLYTTTNPAAGDPLMQAVKNTMGGRPGPSQAQSQAQPFQTPQTSNYQEVGPGGFPPVHSTIPPEMAGIAWAARYTGEAFFAFGGGYGPAWRGNQNVLPRVVTPEVANELPLPSNFKGNTPAFMEYYGYYVDASGNYIRKSPAVSQGYGGGNFGTTTALPSQSYSYGGGGYGGYSYPSPTGHHTPELGPAAGGIVNWRITA